MTPEEKDNLYLSPLLKDGENERGFTKSCACRNCPKAIWTKTGAINKITAFCTVTGSITCQEKGGIVTGCDEQIRYLENARKNG